MHTVYEKTIWVILRLSLGWIFLWAFLDKLFGLGYATKPAQAWLSGGSPTTYFLAKVSTGPFASLFHPLSGVPLVDWLFMLGLLGIGISLVLGIAVRLASLAGAVMLALMWVYLFPSAQNPFMDDHLIYLFLMLGLFVVDAGQWFSVRNLLPQGVVAKMKVLY